MKLTSEPKPVRIRIKSGGEFHSTLDSLRNAFSIDDLKENENEKQFMQWLKRQGEQGKKIAESLQKGNGILECKTVKEYFMLYKLFFDGIVPSGDLEDFDTLTEFFSSDRKWSRNSMILERYRLDNDEKYILSKFESLKEISPKIIKVIRKLSKSSSEAAYKLGMYFYKNDNEAEGVKLLGIAKEKNDSNYSVKAKTFLKLNERINIEDINKMIQSILSNDNGSLKSLSLSKKGKIILDFVEENHKRIKLREGVTKLKRFFEIVSVNVNQKFAESDEFESQRNRRLPLKFIKKCFNNIKKDVLSNERLFIMCLALEDVSDSWEFGYYKEIVSFLEDQKKYLSKSYYPMKYLLEPWEKNSSFSEKRFRVRNLAGKIDFILLNLLKFHDFNK